MDQVLFALLVHPRVGCRSLRAERHQWCLCLINNRVSDPGPAPTVTVLHQQCKTDISDTNVNYNKTHQLMNKAVRRSSAVDMIQAKHGVHDICDGRTDRRTTRRHVCRNIHRMVAQSSERALRDWLTRDMLLLRRLRCLLKRVLQWEMWRWCRDELEEEGGIGKWLWLRRRR